MLPFPQAVKSTKENRILSPRFKDEKSAIMFTGMIESPAELERDRISLAQIARELKIPAFRARAILRKLGMTPESGRWSIPLGTAEYDYIYKLLSKFKRKH